MKKKEQQFEDFELDLSNMGKASEIKNDKAVSEKKGYKNIYLSQDAIKLLEKVTLTLKIDDSKFTQGDAVQVGIKLLAKEKGIKPNSSIMDIEEIKKLPKAKQILLVQDIWDSLGKDKDFELSEEVKAELDGRLDRLEKRVCVFKQARKQLKLTQEEIAKLLGTDQGRISRIERGMIVGPYFVKYLKFLDKRQIDIRRVIRHYQYKV